MWLGCGDQMKSSHNSLFDSMVNEATEEVASKGWRDANQNAVTLAAFGMLSKIIRSHVGSLTKPFWWMAGAVGGSAVWYVVDGVLSRL